MSKWSSDVPKILPSRKTSAIDRYSVNKSKKYYLIEPVHGNFVGETLLKEWEISPLGCFVQWKRNRFASVRLNCTDTTTRLHFNHRTAARWTPQEPVSLREQKHTVVSWNKSSFSIHSRFPPTIISFRRYVYHIPFFKWNFIVLPMTNGSNRRIAFDC